MNAERPSFIKLTNYIYRITQSYTDEVLEKYQLTSGTYPFILILYENEGINQNHISKELNVDKAMSARAIKKLMELQYIKKKEDENDCRAFKLYLTDKAKRIIPEIINELQHWIDIITKGISDEERIVVIEALEKVLRNAKEYRNK